MKILELYNNYKSGGGGETVMAHTSIDVLRANGHTVIPIWRDNAMLEGARAKLRVFVDGVYSREAYRTISELLKQHRPDAVLAYNLYPQFSPAAIEACWDAGVPVVMSVQNHQLTCPTAAHFVNGETCDRCLTAGNEFPCVLHNCKDNAAQSVAYALRSAAARRKGWFSQHVASFLVISEAVRQRMLRAGYDDRRIRILPNAVPLPIEAVQPGKGKFVGFLGRLAKEKGLGVLLEAAAKSGVPVHIAGSGDKLAELQSCAPPNVTFVGWIGRDAVCDFYREARFTVVPSLWPEPFGLVATEAMSYGLPVIAARSGALPEIVTHNQSGLLYEARDSGALARHMRLLWDSPEECVRLGTNARAVVRERYSDNAYYAGLSRALEDAIAEKRHIARGTTSPLVQIKDTLSA